MMKMRDVLKACIVEATGLLCQRDAEYQAQAGEGRRLEERQSHSKAVGWPVTGIAGRIFFPNKTDTLDSAFFGMLGLAI